MEPSQKFEQSARAISRMMGMIFALFMVMGAFLVYLMIDPTFSAFRPDPKVDTVAVATVEEDDYDKIENGIHVRTGFVEGEGLMTVVNNCTNCHSAKLVTQNRMSADRWRATIKWMQETQNLWDLGKNEDIIVTYLATYYAPEKKGRRPNLENIEWYALEQ
ncbi:monoheme cytochrome C [Robiginitalea marina]|uniref:Monoheme cytochrome C n=1 Tax=Robiginitalea marina TaxID=2954105 RepID=A0ABT1B2G7_9FLAO|nr:monoheme cytochrome C [Robiginitalea marina]MCO5725813.1 monoheme cytochrome C [Robiginitalea marina]